MSKKKDPQEKKRAVYEKDHYTFPWSSPHGFRKTWKKKKNHLNRVVRRKAKNLLHAVEGSAFESLGPDEESLTAEFFRKGLSRKRLRKSGVVNVREKIERKTERRESSFNINARSHAARVAGFRKLVTRLLEDTEYTEKNLLELSRAATSGRFQNFLDEEPSWVPKLQQWVLSAQKRLAWRQSQDQPRSSRKKSRPE
jgi:hypothetical protein